MTTQQEAAQRIREYIIARAKVRTINPDVVHALADGDRKPLTIADLCLLVDAVLDPDTDEPYPVDVETEYPHRCDEIGVRGTRCVKTYRHTDDCVFDVAHAAIRQPETGPDQGAA